jgi:cephalosporin-C deacetylase
MYVDLHGEELTQYRSSQVKPADFDAFWSETLQEARDAGSPIEIVQVESPLAAVDVFDVRFSGFGGEQIRAWLRLPSGRTGPLPTVVEFIGYSGGRGFAEENLFWSSCGFAHLHVDTRGQAWTVVGDTPDPNSTGPHGYGVMTTGIEDRATYFYRRLITDSVRAIDAALELECIDPTRIYALGVSQGGGLALAVTSLSPRVARLVSIFPFLCDFPRAITLTDAGPYKEISRYLTVYRDQESSVLKTLAYFDGVNFAKSATAPALFSTALMDSVCPPSTVVGAFQEYAGPKELNVWSHYAHEDCVRYDETRVAHKFLSDDRSH